MKGVQSTSTFEVAEFHGDYVWVEKRVGQKKGLQFAFPIEQLDEYDVGDVLEMTVESANERGTRWNVVAIHSVE